MIDSLRTALARLLVRHLHNPRPLVIQTSIRLAAQAEALEEKLHCLNAVLQLDPEN